MNTTKKPLVYLAGPLFSSAERAFNARLKSNLLPYVNVFLPQEDGGLVRELVAAGAAAHDAARAVFEMDLAAIRKCDLLLLVMDGRVIDEGASVELGVAFALGKECVGLQTDSRRMLLDRNNPMIDCALSQVFHDEVLLFNWASIRWPAPERTETPGVGKLPNDCHRPLQEVEQP